jgi:selenocysteine-specific elongation factor
VHWIIGTAGHIDHGKTSLIKALTGIDTDRLKEEKERGISIDLGFASLELPDGTRAGIVDVPGHERFIRNMLAGAHGIDLVLFTVAADDGVMPQTEEHLDIVHLLGVRRAVFVITKADLVDRARVTQVADDIRALVAGTTLEGSPIVPFACPTGEGLDEIRQTIARTLKNAGKAPPPGRFRLPVDRAFVSAGHGLIVTGTATNGEVHAGDRVRCLPSGEPLRVRSVEVHGEPVETGSWGQRIALNLSGSNLTSITRGDVICDEAVTLTCDRFDAAVEVRPSAARGLKDYQRVRIHMGTAERMGKVIPLGSRRHPGAHTIAPGDRAYCQVTSAEPLAAMRGDHFILRDETAQRTIGGGVVLLPASPKRRRTDPHLLDRLDALDLDNGDDGALFEAMVNDSGEFALPLARLAQLANDVDDRIQSRAAASPSLHAFQLEGDTHYATERACTAAKARVLDSVRAWHASHPLSPGLDVEEARAALPMAVPARIFRALVDELERAGAIVRDGSVLRAPDHRPQVSPGDQAIVDRIAAALRAAPLAPPDVKQLGESLSIDRARLLPLLRVMERQRQVVAVAADLYMAADVVERLRGELERELADGRALTAAAFRDRWQTTRKYAIPILEYFDRAGVTIRMGEVRRLRHPKKA